VQRAKDGSDEEDDPDKMTPLSSSSSNAQRDSTGINPETSKFS